MSRLSIMAAAGLAAGAAAWTGPSTAAERHGQERAAAQSSVADAHDAEFGEPGDPAKPGRTVLVTMREGDGAMFFTPASVTVGEGEQILFRIRNAGELEHEFVIGTHDEIMEHHGLMQKFPGMEHDEPWSIRLQPDGEGEILWRFSRPGGFEFACLIPGHLEAGMKGTLVVTEKP